MWEEPCQSPGTMCNGDRLLILSLDTLLWSGTRGFIRRSTDGGATVERVSAEGGVLFEVPPENPHGGLLLAGSTEPANPSGVLYSRDRGATWSFATAPDAPSPPYSARALLALPQGHPQAGRLIAAGRDGFRYSDDGGRTWLRGDPYASFGYIIEHLALGPDGRVWATGTSTRDVPLFASSDGAQWVQVTAFDAIIEGLVVVEGGSNPEVGVLLVVTHGGEVRRSDDGGQTWRAVGQLPFDEEQDDVGAVELGPDGRLYVAGNGYLSGDENDQVYRTVERAVSVAEVPPAAGAFALGAPYPNPSAGSVVVPLSLGRAAEARVVVYDVLGRQVATLAEGLLEAGAHTLTLEAARLPAGVYLVRAASEEFTTSQRITVVR